MTAEVASVITLKDSVNFIIPSLFILIWQINDGDGDDDDDDDHAAS